MNCKCNDFIMICKYYNFENETKTNKAITKQNRSHIDGKRHVICFRLLLLFPIFILH